MQNYGITSREDFWLSKKSVYEIIIHIYVQGIMERKCKRFFGRG